MKKKSLSHKHSRLESHSLCALLVLLLKHVNVMISEDIEINFLNDAIASARAAADNYSLEHLNLRCSCLSFGM